MAEKKQDDRVEVFVPRGTQKEEPYILIGINGVNYQLPRGQKSMVPPEVAAEYQRAQEAQEAFFSASDRLAEMAK